MKTVVDPALDSIELVYARDYLADIGVDVDPCPIGVRKLHAQNR